MYKFSPKAEHSILTHFKQNSRSHAFQHSIIRACIFLDSKKCSTCIGPALPFCTVPSCTCTERAYNYSIGSRSPSLGLLDLLDAMNSYIASLPTYIYTGRGRSTSRGSYECFISSYTVLREHLCSRIAPINVSPLPPLPGEVWQSWGFDLIRIQLPHPPGNIQIQIPPSTVTRIFFSIRILLYLIK